MKLFQQLYAIERYAKENRFDHKQRYDLRLEQALPICNELVRWIASEYKNTLTKSVLGRAMACCMARWDNLIAYLHDGALEIDNNLVENAIRPVASGDTDRIPLVINNNERSPVAAARAHSRINRIQDSTNIEILKNK